MRKRPAQPVSALKPGIKEGYAVGICSLNVSPASAKVQRSVGSIVRSDSFDFLIGILVLSFLPLLFKAIYRFKINRETRRLLNHEVDSVNLLKDSPSFGISWLLPCIRVGIFKDRSIGRTIAHIFMEHFPHFAAASEDPFQRQSMKLRQPVSVLVVDKHIKVVSNTVSNRKCRGILGQYTSAHVVDVTQNLMHHVLINLVIDPIPSIQHMLIRYRDIVLLSVRPPRDIVIKAALFCTLPHIFHCTHACNIRCYVLFYRIFRRNRLFHKRPRFGLSGVHGDLLGKHIKFAGLNHLMSAPYKLLEQGQQLFTAPLSFFNHANLAEFHLVVTQHFIHGHPESRHVVRIPLYEKFIICLADSVRLYAHFQKVTRIAYNLIGNGHDIRIRLFNASAVLLQLFHG